MERSSGFTPFLVPMWGEGEETALRDWLAGVSFAGAVPSLQQAVAGDFGSEWVVRLLDLGRSALQVTLEAMDLSPGDQVLLPSFICTGVAAAVVRAGLLPVFVDVDDQFNICLGSVMEVASPRVRAVILPHLSGCWARDTESILEWARSRGVYVIEDCAQAQGLVVNGRPAGAFGDAAIFSGHGAKILAGSGGGWVVSRHPKLATAMAGRRLDVEPEESVRMRVEAFARSHGASVWGGAMATGHSRESRETRTGRGAAPVSVQRSHRIGPHEMSEVEAQLLLLQWDKVEAIIGARRENARRWRDLLGEVGIPGLRLPPEKDNVHTKMLLAFEGEKAMKTAQALKEALWRSGVETEESYSPLHLRAPFHRFRRASMPVTERMWRTAFSVPVRPGLCKEDWGRIEGALRMVAVQSRVM